MDNQITKKEIDNLAKEINDKSSLKQLDGVLENQEAFDKLCLMYGIDTTLSLKNKTKMLMAKGREIQKKMNTRENSRKQQIAKSNFRNFIRGR